MDSWTWSWSWSWKTDQHLPGLAVAVGRVGRVAVAAVGGARLQRPWRLSALGPHRFLCLWWWWAAAVAVAVAAVGGARLHRPSAQAQGRHRCFLGLLKRAMV